MVYKMDLRFEMIVAIVIVFWLVLFFSINLWVQLKKQKVRKSKRYFAEYNPPHDFRKSVIEFGTLIFWFLCFLYPILVLANVISRLNLWLLWHFQFDLIFQLTGLVLLSFGFFLFTWSVIARGIYSTSWEMPEDQKLVTWDHIDIYDILHTLVILLCFLVCSLYGLILSQSYHCLQFQGIFLLRERKKSYLSCVSENDM